MREITYSVDILIEGITQMLLHKNPDVEITEDMYPTEYKYTTYLDKEDNLVMPSMNIEASMRDATSGMKKRHSEYPKKLVTAGIQVKEFEPHILLDGKKIHIEDVEKNRWIFAALVNIKGRGRVQRKRTCLPVGWQIKFTLDIFNKVLTPADVKEVMERSGWKTGLGDWRPGSPKPGKFGQFEIVKFNKLKD